MKRFQFKLQTVLDQRKAREDILLAELGELRRQEAEEQSRLKMLRSRLANAGTALEEALRKGRLPGGELERRDEYAKAVRDDVRVQELTLEAVRTRVEAKREEVVNAMRDRKVLEALRDKQERAHLLAQARIEQNELDDMASVRYARGSYE